MITRKLMFAIALLVAVPRVAHAQDGDGKDAPKNNENAGKNQPADKAPPPKPTPPAAPTANDLEKAKQAYIEGKRLIEDEHDIQGGVAKFKESYRLSRNPLLLYNIGYALDSLKDTEGAMIYYRKFLSDTADDAPNRDVAAQRIKVIDRQADADAMFSGTATGGETTGGAATGGAATGGAIHEATPPPKPAHQVTKFEHRVVDSAPPNKPLDLSAFVPESSHWQLTLFYRTAGTSKFESTPMRPRYNELVGRIPASAMHGNTIQYYIEARDRQDKVVGRSGHATSPNLVFVDPSAKPQFYPDIKGGETVDAHAGAGGGAVLGNGSGPNGPSDHPRNLETYARWGTTAGAGAFMTMALTFYFIASDANSGLEGEAYASNNENCPMGPPCRSFSDAQKALQSRGQTFETLTNVMLISGVVAAGAAGYLWYREYERKKERASTPAHRVVITPAVGPGYVGGAAALRF